MEVINIISQPAAISLTLIISILFAIIGIVYSKKYRGINNYLVANRNIGIFSLTSSFVASALGTWILFGPASAATWGGIGAVIGYSLGTAFPLFILIYIGKKIRNSYSKGRTLIEVIRIRFGLNLFKLILFLSIFYMTMDNLSNYNYLFTYLYIIWRSKSFNFYRQYSVYCIWNFITYMF